MVEAVVAKGRSLHVPTGRQIVVGSRPVEINGVTVHRDVMSAEVRIHGPGATVTLPRSEVDRLVELGFCVPNEKRVKANGKGKPVTGVANDPRL
jgi:hypothetical protein